MADVRDWLGLAAGILAVAALIPYVFSILGNRTRPSRVSWAIWTLVGLMTLLSYRASGASATLWVAAAYVFNSLVVLLLAFRYGTNKTSWLDWFCLTGALASIVLWVVLRSAPAALYANIIVDCFGAAPTIRKAYLEPDSEDLLAWMIAFAASALNIVALESWSPQISLYPLYVFLCTGSIASTLLFRRRAHAA